MRRLPLAQHRPGAARCLRRTPLAHRRRRLQHFPGRALLALLLASAVAACDSGPSTPAGPVDDPARRDLHSYANSDEIRVTHIELDLEVGFDERRLRGSAMLSFDRLVEGADALILDTRDLTITAVESWSPTGGFDAATFSLAEADPVLGAPLTVVLPPQATRARVSYETSPGASGLQWLTPEQTAGREQPFMFTQSQAIHARSWIPLQDSPAVRVTYGARIRTPAGLRAVMSAANDPEAAADGDYRFDMPQSIPSYLIALAAGDLAFRSLGERTGVYAEPSVVDAAADEFADTESMMAATEQLYGPYRWERYDLLVLPPSFPFGGMENPRLTFATPTILAGDRSLVSLVAHELAHSWSGNLVTNATWRDFWLNEGFTVYLERRIVEAVYGPDREAMEAVLGLRALHADLDRLDDADQILHVDLAGRDPDAGMTQVPYEKGALFLRRLEEAAGRERFDAFLRGYFDHFAFRSITTADFLAYAAEHLLTDEALAGAVPVEEWVRAPGLPADAPRPASDAFDIVETAAAQWAGGAVRAADLETAAWTTHEWLHFLAVLPERLEPARMAELDGAFGLTASPNAEIAHQWFLLAIRNAYRPADAPLERYLLEIGRRKLILPLYAALAATPAGRDRARAIYRRARPGYHPISTGSIDPLLGWDG
ncbi:MAG: M1 family metallopeptidase [Acidobacteria bacterium]|nr:M1 family metallopeptidase [Acidobacteriota bacterium]